MLSNYISLEVWYTLMKLAGGKNRGVLHSINQIISELKAKEESSLLYVDVSWNQAGTTGYSSLWEPA